MYLSSDVYKHTLFVDSLFELLLEVSTVITSLRSKIQNFQIPTKRKKKGVKTPNAMKDDYVEPASTFTRTRTVFTDDGIAISLVTELPVVPVQQTTPVDDETPSDTVDDAVKNLISAFHQIDLDEDIWSWFERQSDDEDFVVCSLTGVKVPADEVRTFFCPMYSISVFAV